MLHALRSFNPPVRTLMGPGPSDVHPRVLAAMARPTMGHLDPAFIGMMDEIQEMLRAAFATTNPLTLPVPGPGSAGMEACIFNLAEPGDQVVVCRNGVFGGRMAQVVERTGATAIVVDDPWGTAVDLDKVEATLRRHPDAKALAFVHAETSTGAQSDAEAIAALGHRHGCLIIADTVTSLGGTPVRVDAWGLDAVYSGSQKCLSCAPGLSPVSFSQRAVEAMGRRKMPVSSWLLDMDLVMGYWGSGQKRSYHHTAPVNALYGLHEALVMLHEEGLEAAWERHRCNHVLLRDGLEALGISFVVTPEARLPQLNAIRIPPGVDDAATRGWLLQHFGLEIGAGLGDFAGQVWRIGLMGYAASRRNVELCLSALRAALEWAASPAAKSR